MHGGPVLNQPRVTVVDPDGGRWWGVLNCRNIDQNCQNIGIWHSLFSSVVPQVEALHY